jgi:hypothetical protein
LAMIFVTAFIGLTLLFRTFFSWHIETHWVKTFLYAATITAGYFFLLFFILLITP